MFADRNKFRWSMLAIGIISVLLGVAIIIWPEEAQKYFSLAVGITFLAAGILNIVLYFARAVPNDGLSFAFASGAICTLLGIVFLVNQEQALTWMISIVGFFIMAGALLHIQLALNIRRLGGTYYRYLLFAALFTLIVGGLFLFVPFKAGKVLNIFAGIALVVDGLIKIWFVIQMAIVTKKVGDAAKGAATVVMQSFSDAGTTGPATTPRDRTNI